MTLDDRRSRGSGQHSRVFSSALRHGVKINRLVRMNTPL
jgi:hypothetical protein